MRSSATTSTRRMPLAALAVVTATVVGVTACGTTPEPGADGGQTGSVPASDCAGDRPGPAAVVGMDAATGEQRWVRTFGTMMTSFDAGGVLVVMSFEGEAVGIDPGTGAALWCRPGSGPVDTTRSPSGTSGVAVGTKVLTIDPGDTLTAFDALTGQDLWSTTVPPSLLAFLQVRDEEVLLVENVVDVTVAGQPADVTHPVLATVDLATGALVPGPSEVPIADRTTTTSHDGLSLHTEQGPEPYELTVAVNDAATGEGRWRLRRRGVWAQLVDDLVVVVDQDATPEGRWMAVDVLTAYGAADGTERWTIRMDAPFPGVTGAGDDLVMWSSPGEAVAIDAATGQVRWRADHGNPGRGGDHTEPGRYTTFVPSTDGSVLAGVITAERPHRD